MLDRGRRRRGDGDPYDAAGRRVLLAVATLAMALLVLVAVRVGYVSARTLRLPAWPVATGCGLVVAALVAGALWLMSRSR